MRVFIAVIVLIFGFQSLVRADDIRDFQIEGISIGDSLLDYFPKEVILERMKTDYASKKFSRLDSFKEDDANFINYTIYDGMQFHFKTKDKKFIIYSLAAINAYWNNVSECYITKKEVIEDLKNLFPNTSYRDKKRRPHDDDPSGKSLIEEFYFEFNNGELATVSCFDWSEERGTPDQLRIGLFNKEIYDWFGDEAY